jgi:ABC-type branched-subunit amino acid transport system permease subunit
MEVVGGPAELTGPVVGAFATVVARVLAMAGKAVRERG